jgi:hypothetical protein
LLHVEGDYHNSTLFEHRWSFFLSSLKHISAPKQFYSVNIVASTLHLNIPCIGVSIFECTAETLMLAPLPSLVTVHAIAACGQIAELCTIVA